MNKELSREFVPLENCNYGVNEYGEVKNFRTGNILKSFAVSGYSAVNIYIENKRKTVYVHHLVALTFLGYKAKRGLDSINHIDSDKRNPRLDNLEIVSHRRNMAWCYMQKNRALPTGVTENAKGRRKYKAQINYMGKPIYLGSFDNPEDAHQAYLKASDAIREANGLPDYLANRKKYDRVKK